MPSGLTNLNLPQISNLVTWFKRNIVIVTSVMSVLPLFNVIVSQSQNLLLLYHVCCAYYGWRQPLTICFSQFVEQFEAEKARTKRPVTRSQAQFRDPVMDEVFQKKLVDAVPQETRQQSRMLLCGCTDVYTELRQPNPLPTALPDLRKWERLICASGSVDSLLKFVEMMANCILVQLTPHSLQYSTLFAGTNQLRYWFLFWCGVSFPEECFGWRNEGITC